jgi:hypothetical protein
MGWAERWSSSRAGNISDDLFDPWGTEDAWADGVDADILLREFERGGLGQADDRYRTLFLVSE